MDASTFKTYTIHIKPGVLSGFAVASFKLSTEELREMKKRNWMWGVGYDGIWLLLSVGAAAGLSAWFNAPLSSVFFALSRIFMFVVVPKSIFSWGSDEDEKLDVWSRIRRNWLLLSVGAAAGFSAGFNVPLSGVFFALSHIFMFVVVKKSVLMGLWGRREIGCGE